MKIAIIGAGSLAWSSTIIHDLCMTPELHSSTISLMDINEERLNTIYDFARRYAFERKANLKFEKTLDRKEAIKDADFVINMAMVGGHQYYEKMREISEKYGYYRGINSTEWNMVSDYHTIWGYYQFKLAMDIARDIEELSPNAWLLQLANPVFELTTLISRETKVKVIGLCHGHLGYREIIGILNLNEKDLEIESIGLNHVIWMTKFNYKGENAYPILNEWIEKDYKNYFKKWYESSKIFPLDVQLSPAAIDMYKRYGLFPIGDTVRSGTWKYHWNFRTKKKWYGASGGFDSEIGWKFYLDMEERNMNRIKSVLENTQKPLIDIFPSRRSDESVIPIIDSIANDKEGLYQVNVMNKGAIDGIRDDIVVEIPALINRKGIHRLETRSLSKRIMNFVIYPRIQRMEWAIEAFLEGGKQLLFDWLIVDPRTKSNKQIENVINAILSIPENKEMEKHFR
ncbi:MAG: alpha-glucosidase/alpha-galactosidase [Nitrososphaerota archaeon]